MRDTQKKGTAETSAMLDLLASCGYQSHKCHMRRVDVLAMLWIALNRLAAITFTSVGHAYSTTRETLYNVRKGIKFDPQIVRGVAAERLASEGIGALAPGGRPVVHRRCRQPVGAAIPAADRPSFHDLSPTGIVWVTGSSPAPAPSLAPVPAPALTQESPHHAQIEAKETKCKDIPDLSDLEKALGALAGHAAGTGSSGTGFPGCPPPSGTGMEGTATAAHADVGRGVCPGTGTPPGGATPRPPGPDSVLPHSPQSEKRDL